MCFGERRCPSGRRSEDNLPALVIPLGRDGGSVEQVLTGRQLVLWQKDGDKQDQLQYKTK